VAGAGAGTGVRARAGPDGTDGTFKWASSLPLDDCSLGEHWLSSPLELGSSRSLGQARSLLSGRWVSVSLPSLLRLPVDFALLRRRLVIFASDDNVGRVKLKVEPRRLLLALPSWSLDLVLALALPLKALGLVFASEWTLPALKLRNSDRVLDKGISKLIFHRIQSWTKDDHLGKSDCCRALRWNERTIRVHVR